MTSLPSSTFAGSVGAANTSLLGWLFENWLLVLGGFSTVHWGTALLSTAALVSHHSWRQGATWPWRHFLLLLGCMCVDPLVILVFFSSFLWLFARPAAAAMFNAFAETHVALLAVASLVLHESLAGVVISLVSAYRDNRGSRPVPVVVPVSAAPLLLLFPQADS